MPCRGSSRPWLSLDCDESTATPAARTGRKAGRLLLAAECPLDRLDQRLGRRCHPRESAADPFHGCGLDLVSQAAQQRYEPVALAPDDIVDLLGSM